MTLDITPATRADLAEFYGSIPARSVRAVAVRYKGEIKAVAGVTLEKGWGIAFSDIKPHDAPKLTVWRATKEAVKIIARTKVPVVAIPSPNHPNAARYLERLGFIHTGTCEHGEVYQWQD